MDGRKGLACGFGCIGGGGKAEHACEQVRHRRGPVAVQLVAVTFLVEKDPGVTVFGMEQIDQRAHRLCQQGETRLDETIENFHGAVV